MPIHGTIEEAGLPDVLQLLTLGRKSGCLSVVNGDVHGEIYLDVGRVSYAAVANRDRLGELLVKNGRITREQLNEATATQKRGSDRQIGRILLASGSVDRAEIEKYVRLQVEEAVYQLFAWKQGSFTFTSDQQPTRGALLVSLDPGSLLLEGARRVDEWGQIEKKIPSFDLIYQRTKTRTSGEIADDLTEDQKRLLPLLDGTRDVAAIVEATAMSEFDVGKALYGLIVAGIARLVERRAQVRHLDYRELLAYVVREAELADPQRRKAAARHIVDCPDCSARLRTIHVRRTEGRPAVNEEPPQTPAAVAIDYLKSISPTTELMVDVPAPPFEPDDIIEGRLDVAEPVRGERGEGGERRKSGPKPPESPEQRQQREDERRAGRERRQRERRAVTDRRAGVGAVRVTVAAERRRAPRRANERGETSARDRRAVNRRGGSVAVSTTQPFSLPGRATESRRIATIARAEPVVPPPPAAPPAVPAVQPELPWLTTPDESLVMIRQSRSQLPPPEVPRAAVARTTTAPPGAPLTPTLRPAAPRSPVVPAAPAPPRVERRAAVPAPYNPYTTMPMAVGQPHPRLGTPQAVTPQGIFISTRQIAIAATFVGVALLSYLAGSSRARGPGAAVEVATQAPAVNPPAAAATPPRSARPAPESASNVAPVTRAPDISPTTPLAAQNPPRNASASPAPASGRPVPSASVPPAQVATQPPTTAAAPPPAVTPTPAPAPAPAPVVTAPPPAAAPAPTITAAAPAEPDRELATGGWSAVDRGDAITAMGGSIGAIQGLPIESITRSLTGTRARVRVVQLTAAGERIVLTETRSGSPTRAPGTAAVTAVRVMPPSEAYPFSTGTVSLGNLLITAKTSISADALRPLLERLGEIQ